MDAPSDPPIEFLPVVELAKAYDCHVTPFPPRSFLWPHDPDGFSWGTDSWHMTLRPHLVADGVRWLIEYSDDDGHHARLTAEAAIKIIRGGTLDWPE